jgi:hypothetical protein
VRYTARRSFRGGDGGDGVPPGDGGPAGAAENKPDSLQGSFEPGTGGKPCPGGLYRFSFGGSSAPALHLSYTVVKTSGNTDAGTFDVLSGTACGEDAATARWTIQEQSSKSGAAQQTVRFSDFNPYPIYVGPYDNAETIDVKLRLTPGRSPAVGLDVTAPAAFRDVVKTPAQAAITATRVTSCP